MKLLIAGAKPRLFHLKEFGEALTKFDVDYKLVHDVDVYDGWPSRNISHWFQSTHRFKNLVEEFRPDVVFYDRPRHLGLAAIKSNIPLFVFLRGDYWNEVEWAKQTLYKFPHKRLALLKWQKIAEKCFEGSSMILPICKYLENIVKEHYPTKPVQVLRGGIDSSRWYPVKEMDLKHPCVGLLQGAWILGKTKEILTITKVMEEMPDVTFYWAGDGPYRDYVLSTLQKYKNFKWLGNLKYPDSVREYLASIDVYALLSGIDMSPYTLLEAALMERPIVATNVGGIPDSIEDGMTGFLVKKQDSEDLKEKLSNLINDSKKARQMGAAGKQFVNKNFSWEKIAKKFVDIMQSHLNRSSS